MHYTYIIKSINKKYIYVGMTNNPERRIKQHQDGKEQTTAFYRPFKVLLIENFQDRPQARTREKYFKSGCGKEWIKQNLLD